MTSRFLLLCIAYHEKFGEHQINIPRLRFQLSGVEVCSTFDLKLAKLAWTVFSWNGKVSQSSAELKRAISAAAEMRENAYARNRTIPCAPFKSEFRR